MSDMSTSKVKQPKRYPEFVMETAVLENGHPVTEHQESATILYKAFSLATQHHLDIVRKSLIIGSALISAAIILILFFIYSNIEGNILIGSVCPLVIIGFLSIFYGKVIHQPYRIDFVSKVFPVFHLIPHKQSLLFDGSDIFEDQIITYQDFPIQEILNKSTQPEKESITYSDETEYIHELTKKIDLSGRKNTYHFETPALLSNDSMTNALLEVVHLVSSGRPNHNIMKSVLSIEDAMTHKDEIHRLKSAELIIRNMNIEIGRINNRTKQFIDNFDYCMSELHKIHVQRIESMEDRYFSGLDIHADPRNDIDFGYDLYDRKYHIKANTSNFGLNPLNIFQQVIDRLDNSIKKDIMRIRVNSERRIQDITQFHTSDKRKTKHQYDLLIESKELERNAYYQKKNSIHNQIRTLQIDHIDSMDKIKKLERKNTREYNHSVPDYALISMRDREIQGEQIEVNRKNHRIETQQHLIDEADMKTNLLSNEISKLESRREQEIKTILENERKAILTIKHQMHEDILHERDRIDSIIDIRNNQIELLDEFIRCTLPKEKKAHINPLQVRKKRMKNLEKVLIAKLKRGVHERSEILSTIESLNVEYSVLQPTSIYLPFWLIRIRKKSGFSDFVLPPSHIGKPHLNKKSRRKASDILIPFSQDYQDAAQSFNVSRIIESSTISSIHKLNDPRVVEWIDKLSLNGNVHSNIVKEMKKTLRQKYSWRHINA